MDLKISSNPGLRIIEPTQKRKTKLEYVNLCWDLCENYIVGIENGDIPAGNDVKLQVKQFKKNVNDKRYEFKVDKVDRVFKFFSYCNTKYRDKFEQFPMLDWQAFFLALVFGFYHKGTERRKVNEILLFIARKNGKTNFSAAIIIYGLLRDGVAEPNSILLAIGTAQGRIALRAAKTMIYHSPALHRRLQPQRNRILPIDERNQGFCEVMSTVDPDRLEGYNPSMTIIDEVHGFDPEKIPDVYNAIVQGTGERVNPLTILASTAGKHNNIWFKQKIQSFQSVLRGEIEDDSVAALLYHPDDGDDPSSEETWLKANPSMGLIFDKIAIEKAYRKAKNSVAEIDEWYFITKRLNLFADEPTTWIKPDILKKCFKPIDIKDFIGKPCMLSLDLSQSKDLTALGIAFEDEDNPRHFYIFVHFFMANNETKIKRANGFDLAPHIGQFITVSDNERVDGNQIMDKIREINNNYAVEKLLYDPLGAPYFLGDIQKDMDIYIEPYRQTEVKFNVPINFIEDMVAVEKITFQENPVLEWNFGNTVIETRGANENKKIAKNKKKDAVDGVVVTCMCIGGFLDYYYDVIK